MVDLNKLSTQNNALFVAERLSILSVHRQNYQCVAVQASANVCQFSWFVSINVSKLNFKHCIGEKANFSTRPINLWFTKSWSQTSSDTINQLQLLSNRSSVKINKLLVNK